MFESGKENVELPNINDELLKLEGELTDEEAKLSLVKFLRYNLGFTCEFLTGIKLYPFQQIVMKGLFNKAFNMLIMSRGLGKCTWYNDSTILLEKDKGITPITELIPNLDFSQGDRWIDVPEINLYNGKSYQKVNKVLLQPNKQSRKISTNYGFELQGSTNHLIKAITKDCKIDWVKFSDLKEGDYVCINRNNANFGEEVSQEEKDESYLIGLLIGDGCYAPSIKANIKITSADEEILNFCRKYPSTPTIRQQSNNKSKESSFTKDFSTHLLKKYQIKQSLSYDKYIPTSILQNKYKLRECLSGLFDTDGSVFSTERQIEFCTVSEKLAKQVHLSLSLFGIISKLRQKKTKSKFGKCYKITITGKNCPLFFERVGFRLTRKKELNRLWNNKIKYNTNHDVIPYSIEYTKKIKNSFHRKEENLDFQTRSDQKCLSYDSLKKYLEYFSKQSGDKSLLNNLEEIIDENFFFDKIVKIEDSTSNLVDFNIPIGERYWSNGFINHNTWIASVFLFLFCIFNPGTKIIIAGPTFRTARLMFAKLEEIVQSKQAKMLEKCFNTKEPSKRNDVFEWKINGGFIMAIPLSGERVRGLRCDVLVLDEANWLDEDTINRVLMPFLVAKKDITERQKIKEKEDELIKKGLMTEEERTELANDKKVVYLSSAGYTFEYLYKLYIEWLDNIRNLKPEHENFGRYFIAQLAWDSVDSDILDPSIVEEANKAGTENSIFKMEYGAQFCDGSDSYFNAKKMEECTLKDEYPHTLIRGSKDKKYILSIDPNNSDSPSADYFAFAVMELDEEKEQATLVHGYQGLGGLNNHVKYMTYLLTHFNIVFIIGDAAGLDSFIETCNNSEEFFNKNLNLKYLDWDLMLEGEEYARAITTARKQYNLENKVIVIRQFFSTEFIRRANELLQANISYKRIWFASKTVPNPSFFSEEEQKTIPRELVFIGNKDKMTQLDFIDLQDDIIYQTKKQCAMVEFTSTTRGSQNFDLPQHMRRNSNPDRPRKDNYTALVLANWAVKYYFELIKQPEKVQHKTWVPRILK